MSGGKAAALIGQRLGGVRIDRLLAKGLLSDVYLGFNENLNALVAVKVLSPKVMAQGMSTERFMREGRALAQLGHPNIVKIHNVGVEGNRYFIVMDFVQDGANLRILAKKHFLKPYQSLVVARRMAEALEYIHDLGFIHRDIKPANICLRSNGQPILMDFSLIKDEGSDIQLTAPGTIMGTVNFMPPEQAQPGGPFGEVKPASDVYSLGATFYWLLTGQAPFKGRTPMETIIKLIRDPAIPPSQVNHSVPKEIDAICLKCLEKNPANRFQSARELITAIDRAVQEKRAAIQAASAPPAAVDEAPRGRPSSSRAPAAPPPPVNRGWGQVTGSGAMAGPNAPRQNTAPPPVPQWVAQQAAPPPPAPAPWKNAPAQQARPAAQMAPPPPPPPPMPVAPPPMAAARPPMAAARPPMAAARPPMAAARPPMPAAQPPMAAAAARPPQAVAPTAPAAPALELQAEAPRPSPAQPGPTPKPPRATAPAIAPVARPPRRAPKSKNSKYGLIIIVGLVFLFGSIAAAATVFFLIS
jgi:eukaryotic-like serine/threonine-protein kinase